MIWHQQNVIKIFSCFCVVIRNSRRLGAILIFTSHQGYVYSSILQTTCDVKISKFKGLEVSPFIFYHNEETSVTLTHVGRAIHRGSSVRQILAAYHSCLVSPVWSWVKGPVCLVETCWKFLEEFVMPGICLRRHRYQVTSSVLNYHTHLLILKNGRISYTAVVQFHCFRQKSKTRCSEDGMLEKGDWMGHLGSAVPGLAQERSPGS